MPVAVSAEISSPDEVQGIDATLSGTITDEIDGVTPVHPVIVSLHDPVRGDDVPDLWASTQPDGNYEIVGIPVGQYKVIFNAIDGANAYGDELFDEFPCNEGGCDRAGQGTILSLEVGDNFLDQQLAQSGGAGGACGAGELIMARGFEELPDFSINFLTDANTVFTAQGQEFTFTVEFVDNEGAPLDSSNIEWCLEDDSLLSVIPNGMSATVTSTGFAIGSVGLVVRDRRTLVSNTATIAFADLAPDSTYLNSAWVESNQHSSGDLVLTRNGVTELIQVNDVLVSGDQAGVLVRVLTVNVTATQVILTVEPVAITEAFANLDISASSQVQSTNIQFSAPSSRVDILTRVADGPVQDEGFSFDDVECETETGVTYPVDLSEATTDWAFDTSLGGTLRIFDGTLVEFSVFSVATLDFGASTGQLSLGSTLSGGVSCELPLPDFETPSLPLSVFSLALGVQPELGFTLDGSIDTPSFSLAGPSGQVSSEARAGILYTDTGGWEPISDVITESSVSLFEADFSTEFAFALDSRVYGGVGFDLIASVGKGFLSFELARVQFMELGAELNLASDLLTPLDSMDKDYTGPAWELTSNLFGEFKAELSGGLLADVLDRLNINVSIGFSDPEIFDPIGGELAGSPQLGSVMLACMPPSCNLDIGGSDHLSVVVMTNEDRSGQVDYLASKDGAPTLIELTSAGLLHSSSLGEWAPTTEAEDGDYRLFLRVESDPLSAVLPYTLSTTADHRFTVGPVAVLTVEKIEQGSGAPVDGGRVYSTPAGIECGENCEYAYISGSLVTLTAAHGGGWQFVQWANDSDACPGSTDSECEVSLTIDQTARAVFEPLVCRSALGIKSEYWIVLCEDHTGELITSESVPLVDTDGVPDQQVVGDLYMETHIPGVPDKSAKSWFKARWQFDIGGVPISFESAPFLWMAVKNDYISSVGWTLVHVFGYNTDPDFNPTSTQIQRTEYIDGSNYSYIGRRCNFLSKTYESYVTVIVNGSIDFSQSTEEEISPGACPTPDEGGIVNAQSLEGSVIYQCIQMGKTYDNCPLAPL